ncbi:single-stranded DNA-binding protein [Pseudarthrobacter sp. RMG13]|uniref:Single-stranded DNA-binding protein n=1 Tax=Pseudarthrobacter humi TaxID=2952523 RepID=A0ABT1LWB3_9MICC|nr:single-stranded DNA-binding protein [Pseudarthrobacter humi]MCP9001918.1 single-stranded DNA-binding protein [Pseudarthrobacter humi]
MTDTQQGERFTLSPRRITDAEWFGLDANPEGTINVPLVDHYEPLPYPEWCGSEDHHDIRNTSRKAPTIMAGETTITVIGNLTSDPELRFTPVSRGFGNTEGTPVANFTIASTPRTFDAQSKEWKDGETLFLRSTVWREAAENVVASLTKGSRVVASGRLKPRTYETKAGEKRTVIEFEVDEIGLSLRYTAAAPTGSQVVKALNKSAAGVDASGYADDDPWFGKNANDAESAGVPDTASYPAR